MAPRRPNRKRAHNDSSDNEEDETLEAPEAEEPTRSRRSRGAEERVPPRRSVATHVRDRQRAVAEREAGRLARPESKRPALGHADRSKSSVASTPSGVVYMKTQPPDEATAQAAATEWCGPFSVARQLIAKREEAKRLREQEEADDKMHHPLDEAMQELELEQQRKQHPSMQWKASLGASSGNKSFYAKRQQRVDQSTHRFKIPSLFDLCVSFVTDNFEHVESLGVDMDASVRSAIAKALVAAHKLNGSALDVLAETGIDALELADCSNVTEPELAQRLHTLVPAGLRYLVLDQCGRCFTTAAVQALVAHTSTPKVGSGLVALSIGGAYALTDADAATLVQQLAPSTLEFKACNLLGHDLCTSIGTTYTMAQCLVELSLEDIPLSTAQLQVWTTYPDALAQLKSLSLRRIDGLDDAVVVTLLQMTALTLQGLDLTDNHVLTDAVLEGLRLYDPRRLHALNLTGLTQLTAVGLEALFTTVQGAAPPPQLQTLVLAKCDALAVTDDVIRLATLASTQNRRHIDSEGAKPATELLGGGLVHLNVQGSPTLTDAALEHVAATSSRTLQTLNVSFCTKLTDRGLGYCIDHCRKQLATVSVWGNAQLSDDLFDGHVRSKDPTLEMVGVWMKNNTSRTFR